MVVLAREGRSLCVDTSENKRLSSGQLAIPPIPSYRIFEDQPVGLSLEAQIRRLQELYWSDADPDGRGFIPLADALRKAKDFPKAQEILDEGLARHPDSPSGHVVAAWLHLDQGDVEEAEDSFRAVLNIDPNNLSALRGMGTLFQERGDLKGALGFFQDLLQEHPLDGELHARVRELESLPSAPDGAMAGAELEEGSPADEGPGEVGEPEAPEEEDVFGLNWEHAKLQEDRPFPGSVLDDGGREEIVDDHQVWLAEDGVPIPEVRDRQDTLVTTTLGEIYFRQGLLDRAEEVFEALLDRDPGNGLLASRLAAVRAVRRGEVPDPEPDEPAQEEEQKALPVEDPGSGDPAVVPVGGLAPAGSEVVSIESLAPEGPEVVSIGTLAPEGSEVVSIGTLAPEGSEVVSIDSLAPTDRHVVSGRDSVSEDVVPIQSLAPGELDVVSIEALAPDPFGEQAPKGPGDDPTLKAFQSWLDKLP
jgi:tetratricopeptide (TPR) repeat protein